MPTGYTFKVSDGTETTLREYALRCARGMGALIMMRDEPFDAPIPERFEPNDYHLKELGKAVERMTALKAMTPEQIAAEAAAWNEENDAFRLKTARENNERRERYDRLIAETDAWQGAPEGLKDFMLEQLRSSREFDTSNDPLKHTAPSRSPAEWWAAECKDAAWNVKYHSEQAAGERRRTDERNAWIAKLHAALPPQDETP